MIRKSTLLLLFVSLLAVTCKETDTVYQPVNSLTDASVLPAVIYTFPAKNTDGPYYGFSTALTVRFNKLMDLASLHHAIHFISPNGELLPDSNLISSTQGDVATITAVRTNVSSSIYWRVAHAYTLRIDSSAKDVNGNHLTPSFKVTFTPEPVLRVKGTSPASGAKGVNTSAFQLQFNAVVDTSMLSRVRFSPAVAGEWSFNTVNGVPDSSIATFYANSGNFPVGQTFTVSIGSHAFDKSGDSLVGGFTSSFSTAPFSVTNTNPSNGSTNLSPTSTQMYVYFNDGLDTSTVRRAFSISPHVVGQMSYSSDYDFIYFYPTVPLLQDTLYTVTIDTSIRSESGARILQPYNFSFRTGSGGSGYVGLPFEVQYTNPFSYDTNVYLTSEIYISFNTSLDTSTFRSGFSIAPPIAGLIAFTSNGATFSPIRPYAAGATYTVTLAPSVGALAGGNLGTPYSFSFTTEPFMITQTSPQDGSTENGTYAGIYINTDEPVDTSTIRTAFSISPSVPGNFGEYSYDNEFYFSPSAQLQSYTVYTVTISTALKSLDGTPLRAPFKFSFATGE